MIPILFEYSEGMVESIYEPFSTHGIGDLTDAVRCETMVNDQGEYELELDYPAGSDYINQLITDNLILAKADDCHGPQAFRIYSVSKAINNLVTVHAQHISYDLAAVPINPYEATKCVDAVAGLKTHSVLTSYSNPFTFITNVTAEAQNSEGKFKMGEPMSLRAALLDGDDSIKGTFGGNLVFDNYTVKLLAADSEDEDSGKNRGVLIEYGIDLMDLNHEETISELITGVYPYWYGRNAGGDSEFYRYGSVQYSRRSDGSSFKRHRIIPLNVTEFFPNQDSAPSVAQIEAKAREWMAEEHIGEPQFNLTVSYAALGQPVRLHDQVTVRFRSLGIDVASKVQSYKYDTLREICTEVDVGNAKPSFLFDLEDASRLKRGLIPPQRITNNSITSAKLSNGSVGSGQLQNGSVMTRSIDDYAVTGGKIGESAVTETKISTNAVTNTKLAKDSVTSIKIANSAIISRTIHDNAVTYGAVANKQIDTLKLNDFSITSTTLAGSDSGERHVYPDGTEVPMSPAVVEMKIGNETVAYVKLTKDNQGAIDKVWEIDELLVDYAEIKQLVTDNLSAQFGVIGSVSTSSLRIGGRIVSTTSIAPGVPYNDILYLGGWY